MTDSRQAKAAQQQFSQQSEYYAGSQQHRAGEGLGIVRDFVSKSPGGILVDVGTGTGFTALGVSDLMTHVIATDISSGMLNEAERIFSEQARDNIQLCTQRQNHCRLNLIQLMWLRVVKQLTTFTIWH